MHHAHAVKLAAIVMRQVLAKLEAKASVEPDRRIIIRPHLQKDGSGPALSQLGHQAPGQLLADARPPGARIDRQCVEPPPGLRRAQPGESRRPANHDIGSLGNKADDAWTLQEITDLSRFESLGRIGEAEPLQRDDCRHVLRRRGPDAQRVL